jgi:hypothetical protein
LDVELAARVRRNFGEAAAADVMLALARCGVRTVAQLEACPDPAGLAARCANGGGSGGGLPHRAAAKLAAWVEASQAEARRARASETAKQAHEAAARQDTAAKAKAAKAAARAAKDAKVARKALEQNARRDERARTKAEVRASDPDPDDQ